MKQGCSYLKIGCALVALVGPFATANAQQAGPAQDMPAQNSGSSGVSVEDIVVTAQRRNERLQDVPIAVSAVSSSKLTQNGVRDAKDLSIVVPDLNISTPNGTMQPHLRGVGSGASAVGIEQPIAVYIDGVYIASASGSLLTLNNIDRVEVLKGPQGTLFGRNATGGLIQIITKDPTSHLTADGSVGYGNYQTVTADAYVSDGLTDTLSADIAVHYEHQGKGWGTNLLTGNPVYDLDHDLALRSKWLFEPTVNTQIRLALDYSNRRSTRDAFAQSSQNAGLFGPVGFGAYDTPSYGGPFPRGGYYDVNQIDNVTTLKQAGAALSIKQALTDQISLQSITAYRDSKQFVRFDGDITAADLVNIELPGKSDQFTQELQLSSNGTKLKWVTGLYYFHAIDAYTPFRAIFGSSSISPVPGVPVEIDEYHRQVTNAYAGYLQATYEFLPRTNLTLGGRYSHERKQVSGRTDFLIAGTLASSDPFPTPGLGIPTSLSGNNFSYRIAVDHKLNNNILAYASYNTGYKSGGYNLAQPSNQPFKPEKIKAMEVGLKSDLLDRRLRINLSAYRYEYSNIQVSRYVGGSADIYNGAAARMYGGDIDVQAVLGHGLSVNGGLAYNHARFTSFPNADYIVPVAGCVPTIPAMPFCPASAKGKRVPFAPEVTFNVGADYKADLSWGKLDANVSYYRSGKFYAAPDNVGYQPAYDLINASVKLTDPSEKLSLTLWGRNLGDTRYAAALVENPTIDYSAGAPRTYGVTLGVKY